DRSRPLAERNQARKALGEINAVLVFSPRILPGDAFSEVYVVQSGDSLVRIAQERHLETDWRFLKRINGIADERRLREGQRLKLVVGTFHAVISKAEYRMDVYLGEGRERVMVASFPVGLGEYNSTPTGAFKVRPRSKLVNPQWVNPRTGQAFSAEDPKNPIGERWIGLIGTEPSNKDIEGYGIHGTIDPGSIGQQASMGCVRMNAADVEVVYELLTEPDSTIEIIP
ncbi:MAG: L,D-transpeptidase family protein, partial [Phycisphaerales bacterium]|nr:L,D-transpeptidase family protein [Phycisphaerales bacterium]